MPCIIILLIKMIHNFEIDAEPGRGKRTNVHASVEPVPRILSLTTLNHGGAHLGARSTQNTYARDNISVYLRVDPGSALSTLLDSILLLSILDSDV